jgi:hypothetical protein
VTSARTAVVALVLVLAACGIVTPTPSGPVVPITIQNEDDTPARVEVMFYRASDGSEEPVAEPFDLAPGDSTSMSIEATFDRDGAYHVIVNGFVAVSSEFVCDVDQIPARAADLPASVVVVVMENGEPAVCPFRQLPP